MIDDAAAIIVNDNSIIVIHFDEMEVICAADAGM